MKIKNILFKNTKKFILQSKVLSYYKKFPMQKNLLLFLIFSFYFSMSYSQNLNKDQVSSLEEQRAAMVFNLCQEVRWSKINEISTFKIAILGPDNIKNSLSEISKNSRIFEKQIEIKRINNLEDIKDYNVVYVNSTFEYLIKPILDRSKGSEILIITEGYPSNSSMINMVQVGDAYKYDINRQLIRESNLKITSVLAGYAVSSKEIREALYKKLSKSFI